MPDITLDKDSEPGIKFTPTGTYKNFDGVAYSLALTVTGSHEGITAKLRAQESAQDFEAMGYLTHIEHAAPKTYNIWLSKPNDRFYAKMLSLQRKLVDNVRQKR